jgi:two-component system phosphate regulon response regulator OmpR
MSKIALTIGIVEDNDDLRNTLVEVLASHGHHVFGVASAEELTMIVPGRPLSLLVLDLNLPGEDGLSLAARLKRTQPLLRVIMLTTRTSLPDRLVGYESGADLYLPKPIAHLELIAAVEAMSRQITNELACRRNDRSNQLRIHVQRMSLCGPRGTVPLSSRELTLLTALANAPNYSLEHWQLMEILGLDIDSSGKSALAVLVTRLRARMLQAGCPNPALKALRSMGYQLCFPIEILSMDAPMPGFDIRASGVRPAL